MHSRIVRKILLRMLLRVALAMFLVLVVCVAIFLPITRDIALQDLRYEFQTAFYQYDNFFSEIQNIQTILQYDNNLRKLVRTYCDTRQPETGYEIERYLSEFPNTYFTLKGLFLETLSGDMLFSFHLQDYLHDTVAQSDWYQESKDRHFANFSAPYTPTGCDDATIYVNSYMTLTAGTDTVDMVLVYDMSELAAMSQRYLSSAQSGLWTDGQNLFYFGSDTSPLPNQEQILEQIRQARTYELYQLEYSGQHVLFQTSSLSHWTQVFSTSESQLLTEYWRILVSSMVLILVFFLLLLLFLPWVVQQCLSPLMQLTEKMDCISRGEFDARCDVSTGDELEDISNHFNDMIEQIQQYIATVLQQEKEKEQIYYGQLISQMNPHFLYNTLNTIIFLSKESRNADLEEVTRCLIDLLKDVLRIDKDNVYDTLAQEIAIVEQYVTIQNYKYANKIHIDYNLDCSLYNAQIPKFVLQPLVENAIFHGLLGDENNTDRRITITASATDKTLLLQVQDNGIGMDADTLESLRTQRFVQETRGVHVGLKNIILRLGLLYKGNDCISIDSTPGSGTLVRISLDRQQTQENTALLEHPPK